jgi:hypothetical protein
MACGVDDATADRLKAFFSDLIFISLCYKLAGIYLLDYE